MEMGAAGTNPQVLSTPLSPVIYVNEHKVKKKMSQMDIRLEDTEG